MLRTWLSDRDAVPRPSLAGSRQRTDPLSHPETNVRCIRTDKEDQDP